MADPIKKKSMLTREEVRIFYDRFGKKQDWQSFYEDAAVRDMIEHAEFNQAMSAVEFGCGTGRLACDLLANYLPANASYQGFDISATMIDLARQRIDRFGDRARVTLTDGAASLPIQNGSADRFVSTYVLDLLSPEDIHAVLIEARRVLKSDGRLCLVSLTYGPTPLAKAFSWIWGRLQKLNPKIVGGCRPIRIVDYLAADQWQVHYRNVSVAFAISSETVIAKKRT